MKLTWGCFGGDVGASWGYFGGLGLSLGRLGRPLGRSWGALEGSWRDLGVVLEGSWADLGGQGPGITGLKRPLATKMTQKCSPNPSKIDSFSKPKIQSRNPLNLMYKSNLKSSNPIQKSKQSNLEIRSKISTIQSQIPKLKI